MGWYGCCCKYNNDPSYCDVCDFFNLTSVDVTIPTFSDVPGIPTCSGCSGLGGTYNVPRISAIGTPFVGQIAGYITDPCPGRLGAPGCTIQVYRSLNVQLGCFGIDPSQVITLSVRFAIQVIRSGFFCSSSGSTNYLWRWHATNVSASVCPLTSYAVPLVEYQNSGAPECNATGDVLITQ